MNIYTREQADKVYEIFFCAFMKAHKECMNDGIEVGSLISDFKNQLNYVLKETYYE